MGGPQNDLIPKSGTEAPAISLLPVPASAVGDCRNVNGERVEVAYDASTDSLRMIAGSEGVQWANTFWFAWYAFHPSTKNFQK